MKWLRELRRRLNSFAQSDPHFGWLGDPAGDTWVGFVIACIIVFAMLGLSLAVAGAAIGGG